MEGVFEEKKNLIHSNYLGTMEQVNGSFTVSTINTSTNKNMYLPTNEYVFISIQQTN